MTEGKSVISRKIGAVAITALLLFNAFFPIPIGLKDVDEFRARKAEAVAPAVAAVAVLGTALAAYGVYVAANSSEDYTANLGSMFDEFAANTGRTVGELTTTLEGCVTAGAVDFAKLAAAGVLGAIPGFAASMLLKQLAVNGANSTFANSGTVNLGGVIYIAKPVVLPSWFSKIENASSMPSLAGYTPIAYRQLPYNTNSWDVLFASEMEISMKPTTGSYTINGERVEETCMQINQYEVMRVSGYESGGKYYYSSYSGNAYGTIMYPSATVLSSHVTWKRYEKPAVYENENEGVLAVVAEGASEGTYAAPVTGYYEAFVPTAEQIEGGYDSTAVIEAELDEQAVIIDGIQGRVSANETAIGEVQASVNEQLVRVKALEEDVSGLSDEMASLQGDVSAVNSGIDNLDVTLGATNTLVGSILDAVNPLNGGIGLIVTALNPLSPILTAVSAISSVVTGVASTPFDWLKGWWDTLTGWWNSLLTMLGSTPLSTLLAPLSGIASIVGALTGDYGLTNWLGTTTVGDLVSGLDGTISGGFDGLARWLGSTPLSTLLAPLSGIASIVGALTGDYGLLDWLGHTTAGDLAKGITDGIAGVGTAVGTLGKDVTGWLDELLKWLGDTPLAKLIADLLAAIGAVNIGDISLEGVLEAIGAVPGLLADALAGSLEGVLPDWFKLPDAGTPAEPGGGDVIRVPGVIGDGEVANELPDKAPWAYLVALGQEFDAISKSYSSNRSFYFEFDMTEVTGTKYTFDFAPWLNDGYNGLDIAYAIRVGLTAYLCVGLLLWGYGQIERTTLRS